MTDRAIRKWIAQGRLPATRYGGRWLIDQTDLEVRDSCRLREETQWHSETTKNHGERSPGFKAASTRQSKTSGNWSYSDSGRRAEMAKATLDARKEADALRTELLSRTGITAGIVGKTPIRGLLGTPTPTELMVMRDSRDHAASLENAEMRTAKLKLANQAGDTFLAKAIAQAAATQGWSDIVNTYADSATRNTQRTRGTRRHPLRPYDQHRGRPFTIHAPSEIGAATTSVLEAIARGLA